jgi:hypothetical protein
MHLPSVTKRGLITLISLACIALLSGGWYLITKPQRDAEHLVQILQQVQVGHTRIEALARSLREAGATSTSRNGTCQTLGDSFQSTPSGSPVDSGRSSSSVGLGSECDYQVVVINKFLHRLRLAPTAGIVAHVDATSGTVAEMLVFSTIGDYGEIATINFSQVEGQITWCGRDTCVQRGNHSDGTPMRTAVTISADAPPAERNRLLRLNTSCFSKMGGCKNARELLPIAENN